MVSTPPMPVLMVIPTGIGCSIGGYAGDAIPSARLILAASECLITHPNVMNGAVLSWTDHRIQYVEGYAIDRFAAGEIALKPVRKQKIGLLLDEGLEPDLYYRHLQVADACRTTLGLDIGPILKTGVSLDISLTQSQTGTSWGNIGQPDALLRSADKLKELGATAIAVVSRFPDDYETEASNAYRLGKGVDIFAGAEAVISHLLGRHLLLPCAHAPALASLPIDINLDPRAAAEDLGYTFLPSVLMGLSHAPDLVAISENVNQQNYNFTSTELIRSDQLGAVIAPQGALGGEAVLACLERGIPLIAVSNPGVLNVNSKALGIDDCLPVQRDESFITAKNYLEAAGFVLALREGISITSLKRPINSFTLDLAN